MWLCVAGIMGGVLAGVISDRVFQSRRGPVAAILYLGVTLGSVVLLFTYQIPAIEFLGVKLSVPGVMAILISMCVIGVHGMLRRPPWTLVDVKMSGSPWGLSTASSTSGPG